MNQQTIDNQNRIRQEVEDAFKNNEPLLVVSKTNILAQNRSLSEIEGLLRSALTAFEEVRND